MRMVKINGCKWHAVHDISHVADLYIDADFVKSIGLIRFSESKYYLAELTMKDHSIIYGELRSADGNRPTEMNLASERLDELVQSIWG